MSADAYDAKTLVRDLNALRSTGLEEVIVQVVGQPLYRRFEVQRVERGEEPGTIILTAVERNDV